MYSYNANESVFSSSTPMPDVNVYQYCLSSYNEENKSYDVVVTDDSGLYISRVNKVVFEHDIDSTTGYKYNVFREQAEDYHYQMHSSFLTQHHEVVEYQQYMRAAAEASVRHIREDEISYGYTLERKEFHRFWGKWTYTNVDEEVYDLTCTTVENRDFQQPAFDCTLSESKKFRTVIQGRTYSFVAASETVENTFDVVVTSEYTDHTSHTCENTLAEDESIEDASCTDNGKLSSIDS